MRNGLLAVVLFACGSNSSSTTTDGNNGSGGKDSGSGSNGSGGSGSSGPFGCLGKSIPSTAPDPVTLSGSAVTINTSFQVTGLANATIVAEHADGTVIGMTTTDGSGGYSLSLPTGGVPLDVHLEGSASTYRPSALYPAVDLYQNSAAGLVVIVTQAIFNDLAEISGVTQDSSNGAVGVVVLDCNGSAVAGAVVDIPGGTVVYQGSNGVPNGAAIMTGSDGLALVFNVPAGSATLSATVGSMQLRSHVITAEAGVTTTAAIQP